MLQVYGHIYSDCPLVTDDLSEFDVEGGAHALLRAFDLTEANEDGESAVPVVRSTCLSLHVVDPLL